MFVGPEHVVRVVDLTAGDLVSEFGVDFGGTTIIDGCLSPGSSFVALVGATGQVVVAATGDGAILQELRAVDPLHSVAWTAPHQLVALVEADEGVQLDAIDVATGHTATIATIGRQRLWMATAASSC